MKRIPLLTLTLVTATSFAAAQTSGTVSGTWAAGSTVTVTGHLLVPSGQTLTIEPGVSVLFTGRFDLVVQGELIAIGTPGNEILFSRASSAVTWGGIRFQDADDRSILEHCQLEHVRRDDGIYRSVRGGAVSIHDCSPTVRSCEINDNFCGNVFGNGAGAAIHVDAFIFGNASPLIERNHLHHNIADSGGAIATSDFTTPTIRHNLIEDNQATAYGGAMYIRQSATIVGNTIRRNTAANGAGITFWVSSGSAVYNNMIVDNTATAVTGAGGGVYLRYSSAVFLHNTIAGNTAAYGGGIHVLGDSSFGYPTEWVSTIVWGNTSTTQGGNIWVTPGASAVFYLAYCDVEGGWPGTFNFDVDPVFVDPASGDYHIAAGSPCRDHGAPFLPDGLRTDFEGDPRRIGRQPDIGADEAR